MFTKFVYHWQDVPLDAELVRHLEWTNRGSRALCSNPGGS